MLLECRRSWPDCPITGSEWKNMADLTEEQKLDLVSMLACFREPSAIIRHFLLDYGLTIDHKQVGRYDPTRAYFAAGAKWREVFEARREAYLNDVSAVPVAHQAYRLNLMQDGIDAARRNGNWKLVAELAEQAAKEVGGILTNQRKLRINEGKPAARDLSPEERKAALAELIRQAQEKMVADGSAAHGTGD